MGRMGAGEGVEWFLPPFREFQRSWASHPGHGCMPLQGVLEK